MSDSIRQWSRRKSRVPMGTIASTISRPAPIQWGKSWDSMADGSGWTYVPESGFYGSDSFAYHQLSERSGRRKCTLI